MCASIGSCEAALLLKYCSPANQANSIRIPTAAQMLESRRTQARSSQTQVIVELLFGSAVLREVHVLEPGEVVEH